MALLKAQQEIQKIMVKQTSETQINTEKQSNKQACSLFAACTCLSKIRKK